MATRFSSSLPLDNSTDANFRTWTQFIEDTLVTTGGWVVTADTGQTAPASLVHPTVANTKQGYRIYRMADALQATSPVFMRLDFGGTSNASIPGIWLTIGTGSNGSGTITGIVFNGGAVATATISNGGTTTGTAYGSAATNRASLAIGCTVASNGVVVFCIERTKDSVGADTGEGLLLVYNAGTSLNTSRYLTLAGGTQPTAEGLCYILTGRNPSETFAPGDIGVGVVIHIKGIAQQPGTNVMIVNSADVAAEGSFSLTLYGATRTYQQTNAFTPSKVIAGGSTVDNSARCCIRYD